MLKSNKIHDCAVARFKDKRQHACQIQYENFAKCSKFFLDVFSENRTLVFYLTLTRFTLQSQLYTCVDHLFI
jgi:hypothetical protein